MAREGRVAEEDVTGGEERWGESWVERQGSNEGRKDCRRGKQCKKVGVVAWGGDQQKTVGKKERQGKRSRRRVKKEGRVGWHERGGRAGGENWIVEEGYEGWRKCGNRGQKRIAEKQGRGEKIEKRLRKGRRAAEEVRGREESKRG